MRALTVTRLRSRGANAGRNHSFTEKQLARVLHDARSHITEILLNMRGALRLGRFVEGQKLRRCRRKLILSDTTLLKDIFGNRCRGKSIRPAAVKRKMRDDFRQLAWLYVVV